ncbi:hypothetical protein AB6A40_008135 [Gnathostoma spinigerum]|uniref:Protein kinase domain-containing protein n=1 Tax=Gnathostoma spinigerum TaxID=75299 RepID=A0ABD6ENP2_9BILA
MLFKKYLVKPLQVIDLGPYICIVQEYAPRGDLLKRIGKRANLEEDEAKIIFRQLLEALVYLKSVEVLHRDLKCDNVLFDRANNVKLADFGFARYMKANDWSMTFCGSRIYAAPEILKLLLPENRGMKYSGFASDAWSSGVILYVMVTGHMPYDENNLEHTLSEQITYPRSIQLTSSLKELIASILDPDPMTRKTCEEMINSDWLRTTPYQFFS